MICLYDVVMAPKLKQVFVCSKCNTRSPRWAGQCYECKAWNSLVEDVIDEKQEVKELKILSDIEVTTLQS